MFLIKQILPVASVAALASVLMCAVTLAWRGRAQQALVPFIIATGYACGHLFIVGRCSLPPTDTLNWLPILALGAAAVGHALALLPHRRTRMLAAGFVAAGALRLLLHPLFSHAWTGGVGWMWVTGLSVAAVLMMQSLDALSRQSSSRLETPLLLFIVSAGTSIALSLSGSLLLGQFAAVLGAALAGMLALGWRGPVNREASSFVFSLLLMALIVSGHLFAELPATSGLLLAVSPPLAGIPIPASRPLSILATRIVLISAPIALALLLALQASPPLTY
jgi:hypothetical protein